MGPPLIPQRHGGALPSVGLPRAAIIRLKAALGNEIRGGPKVLRWHATYLTASAGLSAAVEEVSQKLGALVGEVLSRAGELETRAAARIRGVKEVASPALNS